MIDPYEIDPDAVYVARIHFRDDDKERHLLVRLRPVNDGAGFEYHDPLSDRVVGFVGRNKLADFVTPLSAWIDPGREASIMAARCGEAEGKLAALQGEYDDLREASRTMLNAAELAGVVSAYRPEAQRLRRALER